MASCSYHLGMLAKYGFVEQAEGGRGRERPWRSASRHLSIRAEGLDPEAVLAAEVAGEVYLDYELGRMKEFGRRLDREPPDWRRRTGTRSVTAYLTADELAAVRAEIDAVLDRYDDRVDDAAARPPGARPVRLVLAAYLPLPPDPAAGTAEVAGADVTDVTEDEEGRR